MQAVAALRGQFGGHQVMTVAEGEQLRAEAAAGPASADGGQDEGRPQGEAAALGEGRRGQGTQGRQRRARPRVAGDTSSSRRGARPSAGPDLGHQLDAEARRRRRAERRVHVRHLTVVDFRSYESAELPLEPGVTTLVGLNGQGKTNLVEALGYLATLSSHRVATDAPLVRFGADPGRRARRRGARRARDDGRARDHPRAGRTGPGSTVRPLSRPRDVLGTLRTVLFAPEDLALVKGDPGERRRFLDELLVARQPRWSGVRSDYDKILKQRGALLKSAAPVLRRGGRRGRAAGIREGSDVVAERDSALHTLDVWDSHLAQVGSQLLYARLRLLRDLGPYLGKAYDEVSAGQSDARVSYKSSLREETAARIAAGEVPEAEELRAEILASLAEVRGQEVERGVCLVGPHRDDVVLTLGELPAKGYASHGESWSFALGLKLAAFQLLRHDLGDDPVLVLDDVFAELDTGRRERLAAMIADCEQVIITAAVPEDVPSRAGRAHVCRDAGVGDRACLTTSAPAGRPGKRFRRSRVGRRVVRRRSGMPPRPRRPRSPGPGPPPRRRACARACDRAAGSRTCRSVSAPAPGATPSCSATSSTSSSPSAAGSATSRSVPSSGGGRRSSGRRSPSTARRSTSSRASSPCAPTPPPGRPSCGCSRRAC